MYCRKSTRSGGRRSTAGPGSTGGWHRDVEGRPAPSRNDEYLFYQALVGIWPLEPPDAEEHQRIIEQVQGYMDKAIHEAKVRTSWISPNADYDAAVREFVAGVLTDSPKNRFLADFPRS